MSEIATVQGSVPATVGSALFGQTQSTPVQTVTVTVEKTPFNEVVNQTRSLDRFDPALGLLTGMALRLNLTVVSSGIAVDVGLFPFFPGFDLIRTSGGMTALWPDGSGDVIIRADALGFSTGFTNGTTIAAFGTAATGSSPVFVENDPELLAFFEGTGALDLPFQILTVSAGNFLIVDPSATNHDFFGTLTVEYLYDPTLPSQPRPEKLAIDRRGESAGAVIVAGASGDTVRGTQGDDVIVGGAGRDTLDGEGGNDLILNHAGGGTIRGGAGDDVLVAGFGRNVIEGGEGNDVLLGGFANDSLNGGAGDDLLLGDPVGAIRFSSADILDGGPGNDRMMGGDGHDVFIFRADGGTNEIAAYGLDPADPRAPTRTGADFVPGVDRIAFAPGTLATADEVFAAMEDVGGSATITFGGTTLTVFGVAEAALRAEDFLFADWFQ